MDDVYQALREHLDSLPGGYPATESGVEIRILKKWFSLEEARLARAVRSEEAGEPPQPELAGVLPALEARRFE